MTELGTYRNLLEAIRSHLTTFGVSAWPRVLDKWISEIAELERRGAPTEALIQHIRRSKKATGGMGSIADIIISPEAGHTISNNDDDIGRANNELRALTAALFHETSRLLKRLAS